MIYRKETTPSSMYFTDDGDGLPVFDIYPSDDARVSAWDDDVDMEDVEDELELECQRNETEYITMPEDDRDDLADDERVPYDALIPAESRGMRGRWRIVVEFEPDAKQPESCNE